MRFRKIRKVRGWECWRLVLVIIVCFVVGLFVGWKQNKFVLSKKTKFFEHPPPDEKFDLSEENMEILGRKKLSVATEKVMELFSRLPPEFEKNVLPPKAPSETFHMEPHNVMTRNLKPGGEAYHFMLFIVKSAPVHVTRREVIRKTWGAVKEVDGLLFNTIFVIGKIESEPLQEILERENKLNGDILQTDTLEGYRNLPFKVLSAMQWLVMKSEQISSSFYTFTDDDCVMNIANIVDFFGNLPFIEEKQEEDFIQSESISPSDVKEIRSINLREDKKLNEVTFPSSSVSQHQVIKEIKITQNNISQSAFNPEPLLEESNSNEVDDDVRENLEIYAKMNPNAKIQIERNTNRYNELSEVIKFKSFTSNLDSESFNLAYKQNSVNLMDHLKVVLKQDNPGKIFRKRRLISDGLYCGFSYDPHGIPHRRLKDKWGVTIEQYSTNLYPAFCHGGMYTMSGRLMSSIFSISTITDYSKFHLEDVLVTGILREKTGVPGSKMIQRGTNPKVKPLMYYVWDSGPRVMLKMSRKWKFFTRALLAKRFEMEAFRNGQKIRWNNYGQKHQKEN